MRDVEGSGVQVGKRGGGQGRGGPSLSQFSHLIGGEVNSEEVEVVWSTGTEMAGYALKGCFEKIRYSERTSKKSALK